MQLYLQAMQLLTWWEHTDWIINNSMVSSMQCLSSEESDHDFWKTKSSKRNQQWGGGGRDQLTIRWRTDKAVTWSLPADTDEKSLQKRHSRAPGKPRASPKCNYKHANMRGQVPVSRGVVPHHKEKWVLPRWHRRAQPSMATVGTFRGLCRPP